MQIELNEQQIDYLKWLLQDELKGRNQSKTTAVIINQIISKLENNG